MATEVNEAKLTFWLKHHFNVLFVGRHGVGKTARVKSLFANQGWEINEDYLYFSAATMDPFCDFVGVPREVTSTIDGKEVHHLEYVRPLSVMRGQIKAIFFDEFNRAPKKIRNAVMELIQFKSVNGLVFPNLKVVWGAINPEDDENDQYDVEPLDPAQKDRFEVQVTLPYACNMGFFRREYGPDFAKGAVEWWNNLPEETKREVSPRRVDYALRMFQSGGDLEDVLPKSANLAKLKEMLSTGPASDKLRQIFKDRDKEAAKAFLADENNYTACVRTVQENPRYMGFFLPLISEEKLSALVESHAKVLQYVLRYANDFYETLENIETAKQNTALASKIHRALDKASGKTVKTIDDPSALNVERNASAAAPFGHKRLAADRFGIVLDEVKATRNIEKGSSYDRQQAFNAIRQAIPNTLEKEDAEKAMGLLDTIIDKSLKKTLGRYRNLVGIVNACVYVLKESGMAYADMAKTYPNVFKWALNEAADDFFFTVKNNESESADD